jgi:hypothetical protein
LEKTYKYNLNGSINRDEKGGGPVSMVRRIRGVMGELGRGVNMERPINVEVLSVGPLFRELDMRRLHHYMERSAFFRHAPV